MELINALSDNCEFVSQKKYTSFQDLQDQAFSQSTIN